MPSYPSGPRSGIPTPVTQVRILPRALVREKARKSEKRRWVPTCESRSGSSGERPEGSLANRYKTGQSRLLTSYYRYELAAAEFPHKDHPESATLSVATTSTRRHSGIV